MFFLGFTRICREIIDVATYALYPESFFGENLAIREVFAFFDSALLLERKGLWEATCLTICL